MLVEDSPEYRHVISFALQEDPDIELISLFSAAEQATRSIVNRATRNIPDVILLDLNLPGISGLEALPELTKLMPESKIIILTHSESAPDVLRAIENGAAGYLLKSSSIQEIKTGIKTVFQGGASVDSKMALFILNSLRKTARRVKKESCLSKREIQILMLISQGFARKEIGEKLEISPKTVANHITNIFEKMNVPNAPAAVAKACRTGLIDTVE